MEMLTSFFALFGFVLMISLGMLLLFGFVLMHLLDATTKKTSHFINKALFNMVSISLITFPFSTTI